MIKWKRPDNANSWEGVDLDGRGYSLVEAA